MWTHSWLSIKTEFVEGTCDISHSYVLGTALESLFSGKSLNPNCQAWHHATGTGNFCSYRL